MARFNVRVEEDRRDEVPGFRQGLEAIFDDPGIEVSFLDDRERSAVDPGALAGIDTFVSYAHEITADSLAEAGRLQLITRGGAGYDNVDIEACTARGVAVSHAPQGPTDSVAQGTLGLLIACAHNLKHFEDGIRERGFDARELHEWGFELGSATLGVIGMGLIGERLLDFLEPFRAAGLEVRTYDPYLSADRAEELGVERVDLDTLLETVDLVTIHVPLTEGTHHMLDEEDFRRMKESAYLVNTSRGGIYPDEDLARAIREGWIAGGAVDVFEDEPDVEGNPLLDVDRCITLPHVTGITRDAMNRIGNLMAESILRVREGDLPNNLLNPAVYDVEVPEEYLSPSYTP